MTILVFTDDTTDQCKYLSNWASTPPQTQQLSIMCSCPDTDIDWILQ